MGWLCEADLETRALMFGDDIVGEQCVMPVLLLLWGISNHEIYDIG